MTITIAQYNQVIDGLRMQLQLLREQIDEKTKLIATFRDANAQWEKVHGLQVQEKDDLRKEIDSLKSRIGTWQSNYEFIRKENDTLRKKLASKPRRKR